MKRSFVLNGLTDMKKVSEKGFTYIEVIISMIILLIGIVGALSALTFAVISVQGSEKKIRAKIIASSAMETIFAVRDMKEKGSIRSWDTIQTQDLNEKGIFLPDWTPVRENPGIDGIYGTADDACDISTDCPVNGIENTSPVLPDFERKIQIQDIKENGVVRKRLINITVKYYVGSLPREEKVSSLIANLQFN